MEVLRNRFINEEFDHVALKAALRDYARPRDKITSLLKSGSIIRVKKGLYVFGPTLARGPVSKESLSNLIYGPSYISLEYALSYHGLIPERVEAVTNVTFKKNKTFSTPLGSFTYQHIHPDRYVFAISQISVDETHTVLMAPAEKALADKLVVSRVGREVHNMRELKQYLVDELRISSLAIRDLDGKLVSRIARAYKYPLLDLLGELISTLKGKK